MEKNMAIVLGMCNIIAACAVYCLWSMRDGDPLSWKCLSAQLVSMRCAMKSEATRTWTRFSKQWQSTPFLVLELSNLLSVSHVVFCKVWGKQANWLTDGVLTLTRGCHVRDKINDVGRHRARQLQSNNWWNSDTVKTYSPTLSSKYLIL